MFAGRRGNKDYTKPRLSAWRRVSKDGSKRGKDGLRTVHTQDSHDTSYSIEEWLKDVNNIRTKIKIDDDIMILKAGAALQGKARKFYNGWRPLVRTWACEDDLVTAFPDHETWHTKLVRAANMKSSDFDSISE
ncbi:hypothetical protein MTP99_006730 [Tenebrio molitor]|nr:hypothetical protein MTP99_006730 [Tenebrio molitor]